jgi:hypothetical protein
MGVIKIESFDVDITSTSASTHTLANSVGSLNNAFVRRITSIDKQSGPVGNTGNIGPHQASGAAFLSGTNTISFRQEITQTQKIVGEVWRYEGTANGPDEFITRGRYAITLANGSTTGNIATSGITNKDKCIPFWTGSTHSATSSGDYDSASVSVFIDASNIIRCRRGSTVGVMVVYVTVVEFVGSNWSIGHGVSNDHNSAPETITLNSDSDSISGNSFDVGSWDNAMIIESSLQSDTSETGLSDNLGVWSPSSTNSALFTHLQDGGSRHDGEVRCNILSHPSLVINRDTNGNVSEGNNTYQSLSFPSGTSTTESINELSLEWFSDTSGTGTAHARGRLSAKITNATGTIQHWVHRSGNNVRIDWGVAQLGLIDGTVKISITDVDSDNIITNNQTNVIINSDGGFGAIQGIGKVELVEFNDYTGLIILQSSIDSWSDTEIQVDINSSGLSNTNCFLFVTSNLGEFGFLPIQVGTPPETYSEAILNMAQPPNHYWRFQNSFDDEIGTATANASISNGITFDSTVLTEGDAYSMLIDAVDDYTGPVNQNDMNGQDEDRRYIGGWIMLDRISQTLSVIWEEGAQVNNMALLNGFGNNAMFQIADAGEDYVQLYLDVPLAPNRPYHFLAKFVGNTYDGGICEAYLDGILQSRSDGNPWEQPVLDSHSGSICWGHSPNESLKVGDDRGVDATTIPFVSPVNCNYAHWYSWAAMILDPVNDIRFTLFEKGALATTKISTDTVENMQAAIDAIRDTVRINSPLAIRVDSVDTDGDFELILDNITFDPLCSIDIQYIGSSILTLIQTNGTSINPDKISTINGGTVVLVDTVITTITGIPDGAEWRLGVTDEASNKLYDIELDGEESKSGSSNLSYSDRYISDTNVVLQITALGFEEKIITFTLGSSNQIIIVTLEQDFNN